MDWRLARSLSTLLGQVNSAYPGRSKASDGTIGNQAHATRPSDHNPNPQGVVCGLDITHDPANGCDAHALAETLRTHRHPNLKYLISNSRIASAKDGWAWRPYTGVNKHNKHIHVSVGVGKDGQSKQPYDDTTPWTIKENSMATNALTKEEVIVLHQAEFGSDPGPNSLGYVGRPLGELLDDWHKSPSTLNNQLAAGTIIAKKDCPTPPPVVSPQTCKCDIEDIAEAVFQRLKEQTNK